MIQPQAHAVLSAALKLGLFEAFGVERGKVRTAEELAVQMGAEKLRFDNERLRNPAGSSHSASPGG